MRKLFLTFIFSNFIFGNGNAAEEITKGKRINLITKVQYHAKGKPCACPEDKTRSNRRCGGISAFCRGGGDNISDCYGKITTDIELKGLRDKHCPL